MARIRRPFRPVLAAVLLTVIVAAGVALPRKARALTIDVKSAILVDSESGGVLFEQNADERLPPASVTKVMTMLLVMEAVDSGRAHWNDPVKTSAFAAGMGGSQVYLKEGEVLSLADMTKAIAMASANDASTAVAEHLYGTEEDFIGAMNKRARQLGLKNTHFQNAHGLPDPKHYSSARDLSIISRELLKHPKILQWSSTWTSSLRGGEFMLSNTNDLIKRYPGADGLKTGHTSEAGFCLSGTAKREGFRLITVILGAKTNEQRVAQTTRLLDYGFRNYARVVVARKGRQLGTVRVAEAGRQNVPVAVPADFGVLVERGRERYVDTRLVALRKLKLPVRKGKPIGELIVLSGKREVGRTQVVALQDVRRANFLLRFLRGIGAFIHRLVFRR